MNRDEALEALEYAFETLSKLPPTGTLEHIGKVIDFLKSPCACRGREPLTVVKGSITDLELEHARRGPDHPFDEFSIACRGRGLHRPIDVLIFDALPAEGAKE